MKNIIIIFLSIFLFGMNQSLNAQSKNMDAVTVQVDGLGCPFCAYGLEKKFKELKGIKKVKIEMETGIMDFEFPTEQQLSISKVEQQVEKAGYTPVSVVITRADGSVETTENNEVADDESDTKSLAFFVAGNCDMCKARIERAAKKVDGVQVANWNKETKQLTVEVIPTVMQDEIASTVAQSGHDTKSAKADATTYKNLPGCCQYDRVQ